MSIAKAPAAPSGRICEKNQRAIAKRTAQIMKYGQYVIIPNGRMYNIQKGSGNR